MGISCAARARCPRSFPGQLQSFTLKCLWWLQACHVLFLHENYGYRCRQAVKQHQTGHVSFCILLERSSQNTSLMASPLLGSCWTTVKADNEKLFAQVHNESKWRIRPVWRCVELLSLKVEKYEKWMNMGYMHAIAGWSELLGKQCSYQIRFWTKTRCNPRILVMKHHIQQIASLANKRWLPGKPPPSFTISSFCFDEAAARIYDKIMMHKYFKCNDVIYI